MSGARRQSISSIRGTAYSIAPHFDGRTQMTWDSLGEAMTRKLMEEVTSLNKRKTSWEFVHEQHDVTVFKKRMIDSRLSFMGRGIIDRSLAEVSEFIRVVDNNMTWDCFLIEARYLEVIHESPIAAAYIGYQRYETKKCMLSTKRDLLYFVSCSHQGEKYIQAGLSIKNPKFPCPVGVKRIEVGPGSGWVMEKLNGSETRTMVTYIGNVDLKGLPIFVMNLVLKRHPLAIHFVRQQMINPSSARARHPSDSVAEALDSEEERDESHHFDLPDDFVPDSRNSSSRPPPPRKSFDVGALDNEGKERYLNSLERKLDRLQGANKRTITSKDIMASLTEARDDHLRQQDTYDSTPTDDHPTHRKNADIRETTPTLSSPNQWGGGGGGGGESAEYFVAVERQRSCCGCWPCFQRQEPVSPFPMKWDKEGGGGGSGEGEGRHSNLGDSLRHSGHPPRDIGFSVNQGVSGLEPAPAPRQSPPRVVREELTSLGPLQSAARHGVGTVRRFVGLGKPKRMEDLTLDHDEERMLLLNQDEDN